MTGALGRRAFALCLAFAFAVSCTETPQGKPAPSRDVEGAPKLARDAGAILVQFAAYDYALAGTFAGAKTRTVTPSRYGTVARDGARQIAAFSSTVLGASLDRTGPVGERLVPLADGLTVLARDGQSFADVGDPGAFARILSDVTAGWQRLRDLAAVLPKDEALEATIGRGTSFAVTAKAERFSLVTAGPYATSAEAQQALRALGSPLNGNATRSAPFVVRLGPYSDRAQAEATSVALAKQGFTTIVSDEQSYSFARGGPVPDAELWREPSRIQEGRAGSRRLALSDDGGWLLLGSDDGYAALFSSDGALRALPQSFAGQSVLAFSDDAKFFAAGGQAVTVLAVPSGQVVGTGIRFTGAATQMLFVPTTRVFVAASKGPTGSNDGGPGLIGGRAPDGELIGQPFPIVTPGAGAQIAASDAGDVYVGTTSGGGYDVEVFRPGRDAQLRSVARIPGVGRALAVDRAAKLACVVTDQGTYRFPLANPKELARIGTAARDVAFSPDGTLYVMEQTALTAIGPDGSVRWKVSLVDGRRLVAARRAIVLDGTDRLVAFTPKDGTAEELGAGGAISDVTATRDGKTIGVVVEERRAVLFTLP